jgi:membrane protein required for colicin V production
MIDWLDIVLAILILGAVILGFVKGLVRELLGFVVVIAGIVLAARWYQPVAAVVGKVVKNEAVANFLGFILVFLGVFLAGAILTGLLTKVMKGTLGFFNHFLGGLVGLVEGVLVGGALVFGLLAFPVNPDAVTNSKLAPICYEGARIFINLIPQDLKDKIKSTYDDVAKGGIPKGGSKNNGQEI